MFHCSMTNPASEESDPGPKGEGDEEEEEVGLGEVEKVA